MTKTQLYAVCALSLPFVSTALAGAAMLAFGRDVVLALRFPVRHRR
jgi:hypothetical protein